MAGSEDRTNRLMWFLAGAVTMAMYLMGPNAILAKGYAFGSFAADWVKTR